ncbi:MAG: FG-GAP repeat domain-containing protein [Burkholderiaceae bacterium]
MNQFFSDQLGHHAGHHRSGKWLLLLAALLLSLGWVPASHAQDCPRELPVNISARSTPLPNNQLFKLDVGENTRQVLLHWDDLPDGSDASGDPPLRVRELVQAIARSLEAMQLQGFRLPKGGPHPCVSGRVIRVYWYENTSARPVGTTASGNRIDVTYSQQAIRQGTVLAESFPGLVYELVRLVQKQYRLGAVSRDWLSNGTARLVAEALGSNHRGQLTAPDRSCRLELLQDPFQSMFPRQNVFRKDGSACRTTVFLRYLMEQLGNQSTSEQSGADAGIRLIRELYEFLESDQSLPRWQSSSRDRIYGAGDFDGDGREELLIASTTHMGLVAFNGADSRVVAVTRLSASLTSDRHLEANDEVLGIGDFNADGRDEFLVRNGGFMTLIGVTGGARFSTVARMPLGTQIFADWRPAFRDQLVGIGDFDGDGADEAMFRGGSRFGVVRLNEAGHFSSPYSTSISRLIRRLNRNPAAINVIGIGDIDGNGRADIVARDRQGLFVWGLDDQDQHKLIWQIDYGAQIPGGWRLRPEDTFWGVSDLDGTVNDVFDEPGLRAEIIVSGLAGIGVIGMDGQSRLPETKGRLAVVSELDVGLVLGPQIRVAAVGQFLDQPGHQMIVRNADTLSLIVYNDESPEPGLVRSLASLTMPPGRLKRAAAPRPQHLNRGRLSGRFNVVDQTYREEMMGGWTAAFSGVQGAHLVLHGSKSLLNVAVDQTSQQSESITQSVNAAPELVLESRINFGQSYRGVIQAVDAFIRRKDAARTLESMWHDFSLMLLVKNSIGPAMGDRYYLRDESPSDHSGDADKDVLTLPVTLAFEPIELADPQTNDAAESILSTSFIGKPYSSQYVFVQPVDYERLVTLSYRTLSTMRWFDVPANRETASPQSAITTVIADHKGPRSVRRDLFRSAADEREQVMLPAGQWMGVVISTAGKVVREHVAVKVTRVLGAD